MEQEQTISLQELFQVLKKRLSLILIITILAAAASAAVSYYVMTPVYQVSTSLMVSNSTNESQEGYNSSDIQTDLKLINTYNDLLTQPHVLKEVIKELDLDMTTGQLAGKITINNKNDSQIVKLSVQDPDPYRAAEIANTTAKVFVEEVNERMQTNNISVLPPAEVTENQSPVSPNPMLNIAIAAVVGLMIGVGLAFLLEYLDNTIKAEQDLEQTLDLPVIGVITDLNDFMKESEAKQAMKPGGEKLGS